MHSRFDTVQSLNVPLCFIDMHASVYLYISNGTGNVLKALQKLWATDFNVNFKHAKCSNTEKANSEVIF